MCKWCYCLTKAKTMQWNLNSIYFFRVLLTRSFWETHSKYPVIVSVLSSLTKIDFCKPLIE